MAGELTGRRVLVVEDNSILAMALSECVESAGAEVLAQRMLKALRERQFGDGLQLDPRAGLCTVPATGIGDRRTFLASAEQALRRARETGGDGGLCVSSE